MGESVNITYDQSGITTSTIVGIESFVFTVRDACIQYLNHHTLESTTSPDYSVTPVIWTGDNSSLKQTVKISEWKKWQANSSDLEEQIRVLCNNFTQHINDFIRADETWDFLTECFWTINRIAKQTFKQYTSAKTDSVLTTYEYYGILGHYEDLDTYRNDVSDLRNGILKDNIIYGNGSSPSMKAAIDALIQHNLDCELCYDYGQRNYKDIREQVIEICRWWCASAVELLAAYADAKEKALTLGVSIDSIFWKMLFFVDRGHSLFGFYGTRKVHTLKSMIPNPSVITYHIHGTNEFSLTIGPNDSSLGTTEPNGTIVDNSPFTISVKAIPNKNVKFIDWSDGVTSKTTRSIDVSGSITLTANFAATKYTVTVVSNDESKGSVSGGKNYKPGSTCDITAVNNVGNAFVKWVDDAGTEIFTPSYSFEVTRNISFTAYFQEMPNCILTLISSPDGAGTFDGLEESYKYSDAAKITAKPASGYKFSYWTDDPEKQTYKTAKRTVYLYENTTLTAVFVAK